MIPRLALPSVGVLAVSAGTALFVAGSPQLGAYAPLAIVAAGTAALVASAALDRSGVLERPPRLRPSVRSPRSPHRGAVATLPVDRDLPGGSEFSASGSEWRVLAAATEPGDETWLSWLPRESRRLGAVWTGLAPRGRYTPGGTGHLVAFPASATPRPSPGPGSQGDDGRVSFAARKRSVYTEEELDAMFPPAGKPSPHFLREAPMKIGCAPTTEGPVNESEFQASVPGDLPNTPADPDTGAPVPDPWSSASGPSRWAPPAESAADGVRSTPTSWGTSEPEVSLEADNPVPPHLRTSGSGGPISRRVLEVSGQKTVCASCSKLVVNLRMSGPCPNCLRPVCTACLREGFVTRGHGWCIDCAELHPASAAATAT